MPSLTHPDALLEGYRASGADLRARAVEDLAELAARLRRAAATVSDQAAVHHDVLFLDWHGTAADVFRGQLLLRVAALHRLAGQLHEVADRAARQAAAGEALRTSGAWAG